MYIAASLTEGAFMRRHAGGAGTAAPADVPRKRISGRPRVTVRPNYVGLPMSGLDADRTNAGESLRDKVGQRAPVRSRKLRSRGTKSRRDGAPRGERAPRLGARRASQGADLLSAFRRSIPSDLSEGGTSDGDRAPQRSPGR